MSENEIENRIKEVVKVRIEEWVKTDGNRKRNGEEKRMARADMCLG